MAFLTQSQLQAMGFKHLGVDVKISDKASIYNCDLIEIGDYSRIDDFCVVSGRVTIGRNVHIAVFNNVAGGELGVTMEDFSGLAYGCHVFSQSDDYTGKSMTNPTVPAQFKSETKAPVVIGRHVIVGTSSIVMPGVTLAEGCSVGAMSWITKSTEPWGVYFGIPAKRIKNRSKKLLELEAEYLAGAGEQ
ncbi:acyltransferase [Pseudomonas xantholysinigenes]|uniref:Chloramphenicol acetyltransferase n=1 Tax=Pseudomonas xantholysinigenes TaxID=2745490 RepID=A0A9E6PYS2_9PSED|nr:acyltransferase [Pseudomonas xantholysinigenes]QXI39796.1 acyltransferase [Pseudomonas xantholysinigenes]